MPAGCAALFLACWPGLALAGDVQVRSSGAPVVVVRDNQVLGTTPLELHDLPAGPLLLGFREAPLTPTAFTQTIAVPEKGVVIWEISLPDRTARAVAAAAPADAGPWAAGAAPAPAPAGPVGDLYVSSTPAGAAVLLDGQPTNQNAPVMLRGLSAGPHLVVAQSDCARGEASVTVAAGVITRAEVATTPGTGSLSVQATPADAAVTVDDVDRGKLPLSLADLSCGEHTLVARAPGYLELRQTVKVRAFSADSVQLDLQRELLGTLVLDVTPLETLLSVDGVQLGAGPRTINPIAAGPHAVEGTLDGYAPAHQDVTVAADQVTRATLTLSPAKPERVKRPRPSASEGHHAPVGRIALNSGLSLLSLGAGYVALSDYQDARSAYDTYLATSDPVKSDRIYSEDVRPKQAAAIGLGAGAVLGAAASVGLWVTTEF